MRNRRNSLKLLWSPYTSLISQQLLHTWNSNLVSDYIYSRFSRLRSRGQYVLHHDNQELPLLFMDSLTHWRRLVWAWVYMMRIDHGQITAQRNRKRWGVAHTCEDGNTGANPGWISMNRISVRPEAGSHIQPSAMSGLTTQHYVVLHSTIVS